jgi:ATP-binding cassette subfamily E protein 1
MSQSKKLRIAIVDPDKCQPLKCRQECRRFCPVNQIGKECVEIREVDFQGKPRRVSTVVESTCVGCGQCVQKCPFKAIQIINLPSALDTILFRYGQNQFQLHSLPQPRRGSCLGLIGSNGCGKTTSLQILCRQVMPNFGRETSSSEAEIIRFFRGSALQSYFTELYRKTLKVSLKPQSVPPREQDLTESVLKLLERTNQLPQDQFILISESLDLPELYEKNIGVLSGGQCQRLWIALTLLQEADIYIFDEPSSFLDIQQRMKTASIIRNLLIQRNKYIIVVEHDLSVLDYLSDQICLLYGKAGAYGIASAPYSVGEGINMFLDGFIEAENVRFRPEGLNFKFGQTETQSPPKTGISATPNEDEGEAIVYTESEITYPELKKTFTGFDLAIQAGQIRSSEVCVLVGSNGTGKTTFIKMLCGLVKPDGGLDVPKLNVSYKPQIIQPKFEGTVQELFYTKIGSAFVHPQFQSEVVRPLQIDHLLDCQVKNLSGGQLQTVAIILALGKPADVYLIDEPSAYLDIEQRFAVAKVIKKFIMSSHSFCFVVEHDFIMSTYLANQVIVFDSPAPGLSRASAPVEASIGFNNFLKLAGVTFRRDRTTFRPRINKPNSQNDQQQKMLGQHYIFDVVLPVPASHVVKTTELDW